MNLGRDKTGFCLHPVAFLEVKAIPTGCKPLGSCLLSWGRGAGLSYCLSCCILGWRSSPQFLLNLGSGLGKSGLFNTCLAPWVKDSQILMNRGEYGPPQHGWDVTKKVNLGLNSARYASLTVVMQSAFVSVGEGPLIDFMRVLLQGECYDF